MTETAISIELAPSPDMLERAFFRKGKMIDLGFIGAGTVGTALAVLLSSQGYRVAAVSSRSAASAEMLANLVEDCPAIGDNQAVADAAEFVFITTPDDAIAGAASRVKWHAGQSVVHCSAADSTDILEPARKAGAQVGVFHPLQSYASVKQAIDNTPGSTFALEAEEPLLTTLKQMAMSLEGRWIELKADDKTAYHISAVMACNYLVTLAKLATDLWQGFSVPQEQAIQALLPLLRGTLSNLETMGIPQCLTGPIARGDTGTIRKHVKMLEKSAPSMLAAYRELGLQTIPIALAKGKIDKNQAQEIESVLKQAD